MDVGVHAKMRDLSLKTMGSSHQQSFAPTRFHEEPKFKSRSDLSQVRLFGSRKPRF